MDASGVRRVVKEYMRCHNLMQQDIVDYSGLSKSYISMFLNGINNTTGAPICDIKTDTAEKLAKAMKMSFLELVIRSEGFAEFRQLPLLSNIDRTSSIDDLVNRAVETIFVSDKGIQGSNAIAYIVSGNELQPEIIQDDIAVVKLDSCFQSGDIVLVAFGNGVATCAHAYRQNDNSVVFVRGVGLKPTLFSSTQTNEYKIFGRIIFIQRTFSP